MQAIGGLIILLILGVTGTNSKNKENNYAENEDVKNNIVLADQIVYLQMKKLGLISVDKNLAKMKVSFVQWRDFAPYFMEELNIIKIESISTSEMVLKDGEKKFIERIIPVYKEIGTDEVIDGKCKEKVNTRTKFKRKSNDNDEYTYHTKILCKTFEVIENKKNQTFEIELIDDSIAM